MKRLARSWRIWRRNTARWLNFCSAKHANKSATNAALLGRLFQRPSVSTHAGTDLEVGLGQHSRNYVSDASFLSKDDPGDHYDRSFRSYPPSRCIAAAGGARG